MVFTQEHDPLDFIRKTAIFDGARVAGINRSFIVVLKSMREFPRYCALILAVTLCLFSGGLPIVIASCPMMNSTKACCLAQDMAGKPAIHPPVDRSCCKTTLAAERSTTEFLRGQENSQYFPVFTELLFLPSSSTCILRAPTFLHLDKQSHSPPLAQLIVSSSILVI